MGPVKQSVTKFYTIEKKPVKDVNKPDIIATGTLVYVWSTPSLFEDNFPVVHSNILDFHHYSWPSLATFTSYGMDGGDGSPKESRVYN